MNTENTAPDAMPIGYTQTMIDELQETLNTIASAKSPTARDKAVMAAHLMNARAARLYLSQIIANGSHWAQMDAEAVNATYRDYEGTITYIADLNRRALRK